MGPNSINHFSSKIAADSMQAAAPAARTASTSGTSAVGGLKINYGDPMKADRLMAGLAALRQAQQATGTYIQSVNPELATI